MPHRYPIEVFWSDEDEGFIAVARDLPGCSSFGETRLEASDELDHAVAAWIAAAQSAGNPVPQPSQRQAEPTHSGKLLVRLPKTLHSKLAKQAEEEDISLNQYVVCLLAESSGAHTVGKAVVQAFGQWVLQSAVGGQPFLRYATAGHDVRQVDVSLLRMTSYSIAGEPFAFAPIPLAAGE